MAGMMRSKDVPMRVTEIHLDEYYCPACGSENNCNDKRLEHRYCPQCGQRIYQNEEDLNDQN